jgi:hypothetical protein
MPRNLKPKKLLGSEQLLTNALITLTVITILALIWCFAEVSGTGWEHFATTVFQIDANQANQLGLWAMVIGFCAWLIHIVSKIEKSGASWRDTSNEHVMAARKCIMYLLFTSATLLILSKGSIGSIIGLALMVLVLALRAGFHFKQFLLKKSIRSYIITLTSLMFIMSITWAFFLR